MSDAVDVIHGVHRQSGTASVFVVPSKTTLDIIENKKMSKKSKKLTAAAASNDFIKRNFLLAGGARAIDKAYEDHAIALNKAAMKDLRNANVALASELARIQNAEHQDLKHLKMKSDQLEIELRAEKHEHAVVKERLQAELTAREEFAAEHQSRVRDLQKRLRDEHTLRTTAESDLRTAREDLVAASQKNEDLKAAAAANSQRDAAVITQQKQGIASLEGVLDRERKLLREVNDRSNELSNRLEAQTVKSEELQAELKATTTRLEDEKAAVTARLEARVESSEATVDALMGKEKRLGEELAAAQERELSLRDTVKKLEAKLEGCQADLTATKSNLTTTHEEVGRLQSCLEEQESLAKYNKEKAIDAEQKLSDTESELYAMMRSLELRVEENVELGVSMEAVQMRWNQLKQDLASREAELESTREEVETVTRTLMAEMKGKVNVLQTELESKDKQLRETNSKLKAATLSSESQEQSARKSSGEAESLRRELMCLRAATEEKVGMLVKTRDDLQQQVEDAQCTLREKDAAINTLKRSTTEDMQALQTETAALSREAARWREHHAHVKQQLDKKERQLQAVEEGAQAAASEAEAMVRQLSEQVKQLTHRLHSTSSELSTEERRTDEIKRELEARLSQAHTQLSSIRENLRVAEESSRANKMEAVRMEQELKLSRDSFNHGSEEVQRLQRENHAAQQRIKALREDLVSANTAHVKEIEEKSRVVNDILSAMQAEEQAKLVAVEEAKQLRHRVLEMETQQSMLKTSLSDSLDSKRRTEDAFGAAQSALHSMKQKAGVYRKENKMLLSNYDSWLKNLVETRTPSPTRRPGSPGERESSSSPPRHYSGGRDTADYHSRRFYGGSGGTTGSKVSDITSDIQSYSEKLNRMFDSRRSYSSQRGL